VRAPLRFRDPHHQDASSATSVSHLAIDHSAGPAAAALSWQVIEPIIDLARALGPEPTTSVRPHLAGPHALSWYAT